MISPIEMSLARNVPTAVIRSGIQKVFVNRLRKERQHVRHIVVISPWITSSNSSSSPFKLLVKIIRSRNFPSYVITRRPQNYAHTEATEVLKSCPTVELIYNENVHAKIYAATGPSPHCFALLGSANLTAGSMELYEIGLFIIGVEAGSSIVEDLANFGIRHLRTRPESQVIKKIDFRRLR
jgi:hypothetical protein